MTSETIGPISWKFPRDPFTLLVDGNNTILAGGDNTVFAGGDNTVFADGGCG